MGDPGGLRRTALPVSTVPHSPGTVLPGYVRRTLWGICAEDTEVSLCLISMKDKKWEIRDIIEFDELNCKGPALFFLKSQYLVCDVFVKSGTSVNQ